MIKYKHEKLVRQVVNEVARTISNRWRMGLDKDDLLQDGRIGAWHADTHYTAEHGASFETYMILCIRWSVYDSLRNMDYIPRHIRKLGMDVPFSGRSINWENYFSNKSNEINDPAYSDYSYDELVDILIQCDGAPRPGILTAFASGMTKVEIGSIYGITKAWAGVLVERRKEKFKQLLAARQ